tara:strand:+ start:99 stop:758 length:660 start_codon:yes stop_codon:yes gene_type:complete
MKAIILAAGKGKRFGEITKIQPKPLIKIGKISLIERNILLLKKHNFKDIVINVSHLSEMIIKELGNGDKFGVNIKYSIEKPEPLETGGGIQNALPLLGDNSFLALNSDIFTDCDLQKISIKKNDLASLVMVKNPSHNLDGDFSLENKRISLNGNNKLTYAGIAIFNPKIFTNIKLKKYKLINILIDNIKNDKISGYEHKGIWHDVGTKDRLETVNKLFF